MDPRLGTFAAPRRYPSASDAAPRLTPLAAAIAALGLTDPAANILKRLSAAALFCAELSAQWIR
jgi:hypothetical protein